MSIRLFAAFAIPDDVAARLLALQAPLAGAKWRPRDNLHLTLRFFDEIAEPIADELDAALEALARGVKPMEVKLKGVGAFGGADPHALIVKAEESAPLMKLAADCEKLARRAGLPPEPRKFTPHVTLAYLSGADFLAVHDLVRVHALFSASFKADRIGLYSSWTKKSAPNLYRLEADYPFYG